ncbi:MAG: winged helix-turn-helix transcriptional regulator [Thermoplasmatota archaeon]
MKGKKLMCMAFCIFLAVNSFPFGKSLDQGDPVNDPKRGPPEEMDIGFGDNPVTLDGSKTGSEWADAGKLSILFDGGNWSIHYKQDGNYLFLAFEYYQETICDISFDVDNNEGDLPQTDDFQLHVSNDKLEMKGTGSGWDFSTVGGWDANLGWVYFREIRIDCDKLGISPGQNKTVGMAIMLRTTFLDCLWPSSSSMLQPSSWGKIYSTDLWEDPTPIDHPPELSGGTVDPLVGEPDDWYNFSINYRDMNLDKPTVHDLVLDGNIYQLYGTGMDYNGNEAFYRSLRIAEGVHSFHFLFSDGTSSIIWPAEGNVSGPYVRYDNTAPRLLDGGIPDNRYWLSEDQYFAPGLIDLEEHFTDDYDDGNLTFEIVHQEEVSRLYCELNGSKLDFTKVEEDWYGVLEFQVKAVDKGVIGPSGREDIRETTSNLFQVEVLPVNDAPVISRIGTEWVSDKDAVFFEGEEAAIQDKEYSIKVVAEDVDIGTGAGDVLDFLLNVTYASVTKLDAYSALISFTPGNHQVGWLRWGLQVLDGMGGSDNISINIMVENVNDGPKIVAYRLEGKEYSIDNGVIEFTGENGALEDEWFNFTLLADDEDINIGLPDSLSYILKSDNERIIIDPYSGIVSFHPGQEDVGLHHFRLNVVDSYGSSYDQGINVTLEVGNVNDPPEITKVISSTGNFVFTQGYELFLIATANDMDLNFDEEEELTFSWISDLDGEIGSGPVLCVSNLSVGFHNITLTVTDKAGTSISYTLRIEITAQHSPYRPDDDENVTGLQIAVFIAIGFLVMVSIICILAFYIHMRVREKNLLDNVRRKMIFDLVRKKSGIHFMAIQKSLDLAVGSLSHHLNLLEKHQVIKSVQDGKYRRFYLYDERIEYKLDLNSLQEMILFIIKKDPGISQTQISKEVGKNKMVVNYHVRILKDIGLISLERDGRETHCFITNTGTDYVVS